MFPLSSGSYFEDVDELHRESVARGRFVRDVDLESDSAIMDLRRKLLEEKSALFETEVNRAAIDVLEYSLKNVVYPKFTRETEEPRVLRDAIEKETQRREQIKKVIEILDRNLNNERNKSVLEIGYWTNPETNESSPNARVALDEYDQKPEYMHKDLYRQREPVLREKQLILEYALEISDSELKRLENALKSWDEQRETTGKATVKELNAMVEKAEQEIKELEELSAKSDKLLQNGTIPRELAVRFKELFNDVNGLQYQYAAKITNLSGMGISPSKVRPFPAVKRFPKQNSILHEANKSGGNR